MQALLLDRQPRHALLLLALAAVHVTVALSMIARRGLLLPQRTACAWRCQHAVAVMALSA